MEQTQKILFTIFALIVAAILLMCVDSIFVETVETYEFTAVITHMDAVRDPSSVDKVSYLISWVDGDKSDVAKVDAATYARYEEGDFIDIGVRVTETRIFHTELTDYKILT